LRIGIITAEYKKGGIGYYVYNLVNKLKERGHKITVFTRGSLYNTEKILEDSVTIYKTPIIPLYPFHIFYQGLFLNKLINKMESSLDLMHCHSPIIPVPKTNLPIITTIHTLYKNDTNKIELYDFRSYVEKLQSSFLYSTEINLFNKSKLITTVSKKLVDEITDYGYKNDNVKYIGNGVDQNKYYPNDARNEFDEKYVLFVGRIGYRKGVFDFLECAENIIKTNKDIKFKMIGKGPLLEKAINQISDKKLSSNVEILGYVDENKLIDLYRNAYLTLIPSYYEGLPNVLLESMASGVPVIATKVGGVPEVISDGTNGILVDPGDVDEMFNKLNYLIENTRIRDDIGIQARNTIIKRYTWDIICSNMEEDYNSIVR
jgi:glycosyltransferase involved in cell wall biosynthesis